MNDLLTDLLADLAAEGNALRGAVAPLSQDQWRAPTPAEGWDVATSIAHLAWTDEAAVVAAGGIEGWDGFLTDLLGVHPDPERIVDETALRGGAVPPADLLARWDASRAAVASTLLAATGKMPWFGPPMSPASMATARLMETWAHGLDVYEAIAVPAPRTDRIKHVCHLGVRTRGFAFAARGLPVPEVGVAVTLTAPSGMVWTWPADDEKAGSVSGSAWDFARVVTQRVHPDDTDLVAVGAEAEQWLSIAQAFAGPPGPGREAIGVRA